MALEQVRLIGGGGTRLTLSCSPLRVFDRVVTGIDKWTLVKTLEGTDNDDRTITIN
jgi:hypothetical protein